jgi:hypothetical protein
MNNMLGQDLRACGAFVWGKGAPQIPPLRYAPVGMTKGGLRLPSRVASGMGRKQVPPLRSAEFLSKLLALANFMRSSLKKTAHVDLSCAT